MKKKNALGRNLKLDFFLRRPFVKVNHVTEDFKAGHLIKTLKVLN
jgi:hypothetical protein